MPRIAIAAACFIFFLLIPALTATGQESSPPPAEPIEQQPADPETEAAEPAASPEEPGEPATLLTPRFEVGQRVVLRQTSRKSKQGDVVVPTIVHVDVLERSGADLVLQWQLVDFEAPAGMSRRDAKAFLAEMAGMKSPAITLHFREGEGLVGLHDWEKARDDMLALTERLMKDKPEVADDPETLAKAMQGVRAMMSTKEGAEAILLKQVRPYFDGSYHEVAPGETMTDEVEVPNSFANDGSMILMARTFTCAADPLDADRLTLTMEITLEPEASRRIMESLMERMMEGMEMDQEPPEFGEIEQRVETSWTLDRRIGWPVAAQSLTRSNVLDQLLEEEFTWTLIGGPTKLER